MPSVLFYGLVLCIQRIIEGHVSVLVGRSPVPLSMDVNCVEDGQWTLVANNVGSTTKDAADSLCHALPKNQTNEEEMIGGRKFIVCPHCCWSSWGRANENLAEQSLILYKTYNLMLFYSILEIEWLAWWWQLVICVL